MDAEIIVLSIGVFISLVLGVVNFLWAWLAKKEKVIIRDPRIKVRVIEDTDLKDVTEQLKLSIDASFKLVCTRGEDVFFEFEPAYLQLNRRLCRQLDKYFLMPPEGRITKWGTQFIGLWDGKLKKGDPVSFLTWEHFRSQESLIKLREESGGRLPVKVDENLKRLEAKYKICWKSGKGKVHSYKLPQKWWHKFVPERIWWRM